MDILLETYYIILPLLVTALMGWIGSMLREQKKRDESRERKQKALSDGVMMVLRYMLQRYHSEYIMQGKITYNQYKNWGDIYSVYTALDGNSVAEDWNDDIEKMEKCESESDASIYEKMLKNMQKVDL